MYDDYWSTCQVPAHAPGLWITSSDFVLKFELSVWEYFDVINIMLCIKHTQFSGWTNQYTAITEPGTLMQKYYFLLHT